MIYAYSEDKRKEELADFIEKEDLLLDDHHDPDKISINAKKSDRPAYSDKEKNFEKLTKAIFDIIGTVQIQGISKYAFNNIKQAADSGNVYAQCFLGKCHEKG